jgi:hypothetical protein
LIVAGSKQPPKSAKDAREAKLARALRDNLKRRKAAQRRKPVMKKS